MAIRNNKKGEITFKTLAYFALPAIMGWIVKELSNEHRKRPTVKRLIIDLITSAISGMIIGWLAFGLTNNQVFAYGISGMGGWMGYHSLEAAMRFLTQKFGGKRK